MIYRHIPLDLSMLPLPGTVNRAPGVFWRPNAAFVDDLAAYLTGKRVLEIFAGNGYLAALLAQRGIDVLSTTIFSGHDGHESGIYHPIEELPAEYAVLKHGVERDVLLVCWPTVTPSVLRAALLWGADRDIVFIGEFTDPSQGLMGMGGCATDEFFESVTVTHRFSSYEGNILEAAVVCRLREDPFKGDERPTPSANL